jgi:hypothetical protein
MYARSKFKNANTDVLKISSSYIMRSNENLGWESVEKVNHLEQCEV